MKLNELESIIMDKYLNELNKTIIYKTIDKVAEKIAQDIYLSIYNEFIHNEHYINDRNNLAAEKKFIINKALNENLIKDKAIEKEVVKNNENLIQNTSINKKIGSAPELPAINDLSEQVLSKENSSKNDLSKDNNSESYQCNNCSRRQIHKTFDNNLNKNSDKDPNKDLNKDPNKKFNDKSKNNSNTNESSENNKLDKNEKEKLYDNIVDTLITILKDNDNKININKLLTDKEANNLLKAIFMLTNIDKDINKDMQLLNSKLFGEDIFNTFFNLK